MLYAPPMTGVVLVNPEGGDAGARLDDLRARFAAHPVVECSAAELPDRVRAAVAAGVDFVAVAGGDGTIRCAAEVLVGSDVPLLPVPVGTRNHFAKDVGIPTVEEARAAVDGTVKRLGVGEVNGRHFVNNSSIGIYPKIVVRRESEQRRLPKGLASVVAAWEQVRRRGQRFGVAIDGRRYRAWLVFVGNGRYGEGLIDLTDREVLGGDELDVRVAKADRPLARIRLLLSLVAGRLARSPLLERACASSLTIDVENRTSVEVALDGEVERMHTPLHYRARPGSLSVLVPTWGEEASAAESFSA